MCQLPPRDCQNDLLYVKLPLQKHQMEVTLEQVALLRSQQIMILLAQRMPPKIQSQRQCPHPQLDPLDSQ